MVLLTFKMIHICRQNRNLTTTFHLTVIPTLCLTLITSSILLTYRLLEPKITFKLSVPKILSANLHHNYLLCIKICCTNTLV